MFQAIIAIIAGLVLISAYTRGMLGRCLLPFGTVVGLAALVSGAVSLGSLVGVALLLAGLVLAMNTLYSVPSIGGQLKAFGLWLSRYRFPLGLANLVLGISLLM